MAAATEAAVTWAAASGRRRGGWCLLGLVALSACAASPSPAPRTAARAAAVAADPNVPAPLLPFLGAHFGTLHIHGAGATAPVPMALEVAPTSDPQRLRWCIRYGEGSEAQTRDYRLVVDDVAAGRYWIDEQNGIELPARLIDGELVSVFTVQDTALVVRYRAVAGGIDFHLESFRCQLPDLAAGEAVVPPGHGVRGIGTFQSHRAALRRRG